MSRQDGEQGDQAVVPHQLCRSCKAFVAELQKDLLSVSRPQEMLYRFTGMSAMMDGLQSRSCHLCSIVLGEFEELRLMSKHRPPIEDLRSADIGARVEVVANSPEVREEAAAFADPRWEALEITIGTIVNGSLSDPLIAAYLYHHPSDDFEEFRHGTEHANSSIVARARVSTWPCSPAYVRLLEHWITTCKGLHVSCRPRGGLRSPTRLLEIHDDDNMAVTLVTRAMTHGAEYATLSYCWGQVPQPMLLRSNYKDMKSKGIAFTSLTNVAQDAVTVCRTLSVRYLWIDALCIIQGRDGDFQQEAARMEDVYAGSLLNIVAAASRNTTQRFLQSRNPLPWIDCQLRTDFAPRHRGYVRGYVRSRFFCDDFDNVPGRFAVDARGWTFQERLLSPRSLYFGEKGLHWECRSGVACEYSPRIEANHTGQGGFFPEGFLKLTYAAFDELDSDIASPSVSYRFRELWRVLLEKYIDTHLSFETDRLVAMMGLIRSLEHKFSIKASYGLWLPFFLDELLWSVPLVDNEKTRILDIAPSWSWVNLRDCRTCTFKSSLHGWEAGADRRQICSTSAEVISLPLTTDFTDTVKENFGQSNNSTNPAGVVRLRGRLVRCSERHERPLTWLDPLDCPTDARRNVTLYDPDSAIQEVCDLYCLLIRREYWQMTGRRPSTPDDGHDCEILDHILVLRKVNNGELRFQRVGIAREGLGITNDASELQYTFPGLSGGREVEIEVV